MKSFAITLAAASLVAAAGAGHAALVDRGGGMIYDTTRDITWLADMNYAQSSGYDADGRMTWDTAVQWAANLVYGGFDDWRLPTLDPSDTSCSNTANLGGAFPLQYYGYNCTGGELSGLFATDLGNKPHESVLDQTGDTAEQIANLALFGNVQSSHYWSGTEFAPDTDFVWSLGTDDGLQNFGGKDFAFHAVAVRSGDTVSRVPEPQSLALSLLGLLGLACTRWPRPR